MKKIISQIEKIRDINVNKKLVIFVGAGVSQNSGVCSWWKLVKEIADRIGYNKCGDCKVKNPICGGCGERLELCSFNGFKCENKYNFSSDDFLIIPQHYFESLDGNKPEYYQLLKDKFCKPIKSNNIDEMIVDLNPEHIITTNYDHLLEDTRNPNVSKYTIVKNDDEMLSKSGRNYIIKMHGDIDDLKHIVLKEDDYLKYSQNHIIMESYIKSLLIDKTFLFVGYSLNDNNLKLIMSYIDYFVKEKNISKQDLHYLVVNEIKNKDRDHKYWKNKGVELVDLMQVNDVMLKNSESKGIDDERGKKLYTFLNYVKNDKLPYTGDRTARLSDALTKTAKDSFSCFRFVSYRTLGFKSTIDFKQEQDTNDILFDLSIKNKYTEIMKELESSPDTSEKAYYYSLIKYKDGLEETMNAIEETMNSIDYLHLTNQQYYDLAVYEFNNICYRNLTYHDGNSEYFERLNSLLDNAVAQYGEAFKTIKDITDRNSEIQEMNQILLSHEEYYMKKSTMSKMGGTIHGDLVQIQQIAYDYYIFYKKNYLMLDWFSNVEKMVTPYIKAILCTYYPDSYQYSSNTLLLGRTQVKPYPLEIIDIDMIVKHIKHKDLGTWISHYKVYSVKIIPDIATLFEDFCISMETFWNIHLIEQLETFSLLLSLSEMSVEQIKKIVDEFINLSTPDKTTNIRALTNNIFAIWTFVERHYDKTIESYTRLLELLINYEIITQPTSHSSAYPDLVKKLSENSNEEIYQKCYKIVAENTDNRQKSFLVFVYHPILLKNQAVEWKAWILDNINNNWIEEVFDYLEQGILPYNDAIKEYFVNRFMEFDNKEKIYGIQSYPDHKGDSICNIIILLLQGKIGQLDDIKFLESYASENDYLRFLFYPNDFDYSKITIADYMWCNFMNVDKFREIILEHKSDFWTEYDERRINLGFGSARENRVAYKYFFD